MGGTWSLADLTDQTGRTFLVTGTTLGGLGYYAALELARAGGRVILAGRNPERLGEARASASFEGLRPARITRPPARASSSAA